MDQKHLIVLLRHRLTLGRYLLDFTLADRMDLEEGMRTKDGPKKPSQAVPWPPGLLCTKLPSLELWVRQTDGKLEGKRGLLRTSTTRP